MKLRTISISLALLAACGGTEPTDIDTSAPADAGGDDMAAEPDSGSDAGTTASGACINPGDLDVHRTNDVKQGVTSCALDCFGAPSCMRSCLVDDVSLSMPCAECYVEATSCTVRSCIAVCSGADSPECSQCRDENGCNSGFMECSGLASP